MHHPIHGSPWATLGSKCGMTRIEAGVFASIALARDEAIRFEAIRPARIDALNLINANKKPMRRTYGS